MLRRTFAWAAVALCVLLGAAPLSAEELYRYFDESSGPAETFLASQPAANAPSDEAPRNTPPTTPRSSARNSYARLARAPHMLGDEFSNAGQLAEQALFVDQNGIQFKGNGNFTDLVLGGGRGLKVAENNKPLPQDRVYFIYNGFQNAINVGQPVPSDANFNRYTLGFEKTYLDGLWSINLGLPLNNQVSTNSDAFTLNASHFGNLTMFLKRLMVSTEDFAVSGGLGIRLPTGSDLIGQTHQLNELTNLINVQNLVIQNQAIHLVPYLGFLSAPNDDWFMQGFLDVDFAGNGNRVNFGTPARKVGMLTEQNLLHLDLSIGRWLYQNPEAPYLTGVAAVAEVHYTSTIQDSDRLVLPADALTGQFANGEFRNRANRTDILNLTGGVQMQIGSTSFRVGCVVPLRSQPNRQFDAEIQCSMNRFF